MSQPERQNDGDSARSLLMPDGMMRNLVLGVVARVDVVFSAGGIGREGGFGDGWGSFYSCPGEKRLCWLVGLSRKPVLALLCVA